MSRCSQLRRAVVIRRMSSVSRLPTRLSLSRLLGPTNAVVAAFFLSHMSRARAAQFVESLVNRVNSAGLVVLLDNNYVEGSNHPITRVDGSANTYQERRLEDGTRFEVLKNFYSEAQLVELSACAGHLEQFTYYWLMWLGKPVTQGNR